MNDIDDRNVSDYEMDDLESETDLQDNPDAENEVETKRRPRITKLTSIINIIRDYVKLGNKRKVFYFKTKRINAATYMVHKRYKRPTLKLKIPDQLRKAELEMGTIASLREMYFNRPKHLKDLEEISTDKDTKGDEVHAIKSSLSNLLDPTNVFECYLKRYKQKDLHDSFKSIERKHAKKQKSRDAIRKGIVMSVFNTDDDNIFSNRELHKIHRMKYCIPLPIEETKKVTHKEIWESEELVKHLPDFSPTKDDTILESRYGEGESDKEPLSIPELEKRLKKYLVNWFRRESPKVECQDSLHEFQFHKNVYPRQYTFFTEKSRLDAAIKYLKYAKIIYPNLECMKVLNELQDFVGPFTLDELQAQTRTIGSVLQRPKQKLRYFRKLLKETKELENMFVGPEIEAGVIDDLKQENITPEIIKKQEEHLKTLFKTNNMSNLYHKYAESCLPPPFNENFISIASSLMKYSVYVSNDPEAKKYKKEITKLIAKLLELTLESMRWIIDSIFRCRDFYEFTEDIEKETSEDDAEEHSASESSKEALDLVIKKLIVHILRCTNLSSVFDYNIPDIYSTESQ